VACCTNLGSGHGCALLTLEGKIVAVAKAGLGDVDRIGDGSAGGAGVATVAMDICDSAKAPGVASVRAGLAGGAGCVLGILERGRTCVKSLVSTPLDELSFGFPGEAWGGETGRRI